MEARDTVWAAKSGSCDAALCVPNCFLGTSPGGDINVNFCADMGRQKKVTDSAFGCLIICCCCQNYLSRRNLTATFALGLLSGLEHVCAA